MINKTTKIDYRFNKRYFSDIKKEHLSELKNWRNSQRDVLRQEKLLTDADQKEWFNRISNDDTQAIFAILEPNEKNINKFIGYCGIVNIDYKDFTGEVSFLVDPDRVNDLFLYRKDFLSALYVLCCYGFENLNLRKLYAETYMFREYHIKILEEFGFKSGEILKERKFVNGKYWDSIIHSVLKNEWPKIKKEIEGGLEK
ncbi:MAG: GNAT family N-acetyltransferase [Candidatus Cloacimonetes bacterium]|nr:GNAT family N-acetyltransferase [Candidatus Cloacimonadota bacterium]